MSDSERLLRLVGDSDKASGGGLPLPDVFTAVVQELLDNGPQETEHLVKIVEKSMSWKKERVFATWQTWYGFADDVLAQLQEAGLVEPVLGRWYLALKFRAGRRLIVIPEKDIGIVVFAKDDRVRRDALTRARLDIRRVAAQLTGDGVKDREITEAVKVLLGLLGDNPDAEERRELKREALGERPTPEELARQKYGLDGGPTGRSKHKFGADGKRICSVCNVPRLPDEFRVYADYRKGAGWFLRPYCKGCEEDVHYRNKQDRESKS